MACDVSLLCTELHTKQERGFGCRGTSQKRCEFRKNFGPLFFLVLNYTENVNAESVIRTGVNRVFRSLCKDCSRYFSLQVNVLIEMISRWEQKHMQIFMQSLRCCCPILNVFEIC